RGMDGFSKVLLERHQDGLDAQARHYLGRISAGAQRMSQLIDGLLALSRVSRQPLARRPVKLDELARKVVARLMDGDPARAVDVVIAPDLRAQADPALVESVLENLLGNAWKFTARRARASIEVGAEPGSGTPTFFVRDNGAGFDPRYADQLFQAFRRLHSSADFEGNGIGLAIVQRIVRRHGGRVWAESRPGQGATFYFTLRDRR
ncbi:MAG: ATP-binding protein, partial [Myxococcota bacterium]